MRRVLVNDIRVDNRGIFFADSGREVVVDALFDGRRIWSFWLHRDGVKEGRGRRVAWPPSLTQFLNGRTELTLTEHAGQQVLFREEIELGTGEDRIAIVNKQGKPLSLDKYLHRVQSFDTRTAEHVAPLLDAIDDVLSALKTAGLQPFLAYGTLLGAVRSGGLIGHDSDADLGYVSHHQNPADVILESFRIQRALSAAGYRATRYSGAAFKVDVREADGALRGLDVFGGFMRDGQLHLMGEIRTPFRHEWVFPLGQASLEGRFYPVPADTDRFLSATYGENWRAPDPAFHFETPLSTSRRLNGWFRGIRVGRGLWDRIYSQEARATDGQPSDLALWAAQRTPAAASFVDIGCGRGDDVAFMADRGLASLGLDFQPRSFRLRAKSLPEGSLATFWTCNLLELRQIMVASALAARLPGPRIVMARHLVDAVGAPARAALWRAARMMLTGVEGSLYVEFLCEQGDDNYAARNHVRVRRPRAVANELRQAGARIVSREIVAVSPDAGASSTCRMVAEWDR